MTPNDISEIKQDLHHIIRLLQSIEHILINAPAPGGDGKR